MYDIDIVKLADGRHIFDFVFDPAFFAMFEGSLLENGSGQVRVVLDRTPSMLTLDFHLQGEVELTCDRSLDPYMHKVDEQRSVRMKFGDHREELSDELMLIENNTERINVAQLIYEFLTLAVPMRKLHPRYVQDGEEVPFFFSTAEEEQPEQIETQDTTDPRWSELKKLKNKDNGTS